MGSKCRAGPHPPMPEIAGVGRVIPADAEMTRQTMSNLEIDMAGVTRPAC
jgi:hypothetical protein